MAQGAKKRASGEPNTANDLMPSPILGLAEHLEAQADNFPTKGERTRCRFKAAAARILGEKGYHDLRMADICDAAGLSHGAIYEYYANKKEISVEVINELSVHGPRIMLKVKPKGDEFTKLYQVNLVWVKFFSKNVGLMRSMRQVSDDIEEFRQSYIRYNNEWYDRIAGHILRVVGKPPRAGAASKLLARALGAMSDEFLHDVYIRRVPSLAELADSPETLAKLISVLWYRMAYVANPPVEFKGKYGSILDIALTERA